MKYKFLLLILVCFSCAVDEDEPCTETVCPDGFNNCIEKPCEF